MHGVSGIELFRLEELQCGNHGDLHAQGYGGMAHPFMLM